MKPDETLILRLFSTIHYVLAIPASHRGFVVLGRGNGKDGRLRHLGSTPSCRTASGRSLNLDICHIVAVREMGPAVLRPALRPELAVNRSVLVWQS